MSDTITALIEERDIITVNFAEKEIVKVNFKVLDVIQYYRKYVLANLIIEEPHSVASLPSKRFVTAKEFIQETFSVYLNGIREKHFTIIDDNTFDMPIDILSDDDITVEYIEKT
jgi:hypothetical protein